MWFQKCIGHTCILFTNPGKVDVTEKLRKDHIWKDRPHLHQTLKVLLKSSWSQWGQNQPWHWVSAWARLDWPVPDLGPKHHLPAEGDQSWGVKTVSWLKCHQNKEILLHNIFTVLIHPSRISGLMTLPLLYSFSLSSFVTPHSHAQIHEMSIFFCYPDRLSLSFHLTSFQSNHYG